MPLFPMIQSYVELIANSVRSYPFIIFLFFIGLYMTVSLRGVQFARAGYAFRVLMGKKDQQEGRGEVSNFEALAAVLSGTIGTGNIAGVATAITLGGPGAIFWMWVTGLLGMALKFSSCLLSHYYRRVDAAGEIAGGPMYTIKYGLRMPILGGFFAFFVALSSITTGGMVQAHSVIDGLSYVFPFVGHYKLFIALLLAVLVGLVVLGGVKRIAHVAAVVVPFMALAYCAAALLILVLNASLLPAAFHLIFTSAFDWHAAGGAAFGAAIQYGVARGLFASEAGLGTAAIAMAATKTNYSVRAGLIGMVGPWFDTMLICTMTALVIIMTNATWETEPVLQGASLSAFAFEKGLQSIGPLASHIGGIIVGAGLVFFAYTTMIVWAYYGDRAVQYLLGAKSVLPYRLFYIGLIVLGALSSIEFVWNLADMTNILMAVPNLISIVVLSGMIRKMSVSYFADKTEL